MPYPARPGPHALVTPALSRRAGQVAHEQPRGVVDSVADNDGLALDAVGVGVGVDVDVVLDVDAVDVDVLVVSADRPPRRQGAAGWAALLAPQAVNMHGPCR